MSRPVSAKPKYQTVLDQLNRDIVTGRYQPGQKFPSEAALVKRLGVSRITVGRALRELQQRGPPHSREGLVFGLIIPNLGETEIFEPICKAIAASRDAQGHALLWAHADATASSKEEQGLQLCHQCIRRAVSGVFFAPLELSASSAAVNDRIMKLLRDAGIPVVLLDRRSDEMSARDRCDLVGIDNHRAGYIATRAPFAARRAPDRVSWI